MPQPATKPKLKTGAKLKARQRKRSTVRGGFVVIRRGDSTSTLRCSPFPIEHGTLDATLAEAHRIAAVHRREFVVFGEVSAVLPPAANAPIAERAPAMVPMPAQLQQADAGGRRRRIRWNATADDAAVVSRIVSRAKAAGLIFEGYDAQTCRMDLIATHLNGNPLRLADLLAADDFNFSHDICGIAACIDRETAKLTRNFSPRFSARSQKAAA